MSLFRDIKNLAIKIAHKFKDNPEDLKKRTTARDAELKKLIVEGGATSFVSRLKDRLVGFFKSKKKTQEFTDVIREKVSIPGTDFAALRITLNELLHDAIKANMGDGTRKGILNYRTGRLAGKFGNSANITSIQRINNDIVAKFTFMRYPYDTFMPGGRLQNPASRRPDLLIGKSIRELAATQAQIRLRTILEPK